LTKNRASSLTSCCRSSPTACSPSRCSRPCCC
jgi:hypothetical protein